MHNRIFILSLIFIFSAGLFAGDAGDRKKSNGKSTTTGKTNTSGNLNIEGAAAEGISFLNANGDTLMQVREDGQVIIGAAVANGNAVLDVDALNNDKGIMLPRLTRDERFAMSLTPADEGLLIYDETSSRFWYWQGSQWEVVGNNVGDNLGDHTVRQTLNLNDYYLSGDGDSEGLYIDDDGNVGIGTIVPGSELEVEGTITGTSFVGDGSGLTGLPSSPWSVNNTDIFFNGGNVGIGTATPSKRFHVDDGDVLISRTVTNSSDASLTIEGRRSAGGPPAASLYFENSDADDSNTRYTAAAIRSHNSGDSDDGDLQFFTTSDLALAERMRITSDGNVGIGTPAPGSELEVEGTITATEIAANQITVEQNVNGGTLLELNISGGRFWAFQKEDQDLRLRNISPGTRRFYIDTNTETAFRNADGTATGVSIAHSSGTVTATAFVGDGSGLTGISGDNLGSHTATQMLDLANNNISNGDTVTATAFVGDGSGLTGIAGDNLGSHTATQTLDLADNNITNGDTVTASAFVGDGSGLTGIAGDNLGSHTATQVLDLANNNVANGDTITANVFVGDGSGLTNMNGWQLTGNAGTGGSDFIGTTDDQPLVFKANNKTILRLYDKSTSPNVIGGFSGNSFSTGVEGATISGGGSSAAINAVTGNYSTIGGGLGNQAGGNSRELATVSGGGSNTASNGEATVSGGYLNTASGLGSTIGGGNSNNATMNDATVSGGIQNTASGIASAVGGGFGNQATNDNSTISGGSENIADGLRSTIGGGRKNTASGIYATVPGGRLNSAAGEYSFASGRRAKIADTHDGTFLYSDQNDVDFNSAAANEFAVRATGGVRFVTGIDGAGNPTQTVGIDSDGNVGIGTMTPAAPLDIVKTVNNDAVVKLRNNGTVGAQVLNVSSNVTGTADIVDFQNGAFVVQGNGNVGIGTTAPGHRLHVKGSSIALTEGAQSLSLRTSETNGYVQLDVGGSGHSGDKIYIGDLTNNTNEVIMMGDVGIGTSAPEEKLHIKSSGANDAKIIIEGDANDDPMIEFRDDAGTIGFIGWDNSENAIRITAESHLYNSSGISINPDGNVGIGTTDPIRAKVEIQGHTGVLPLSYGWLNNTGNTGTASNGNGRYSLYASDRIAAVEFNAFSDERIKNIRGRSDSKQDLNTLMDIEITDYTMIDTVAKGSQSHKKVIAQQVKDVFPQAVSTMTDVVPDIYQLSEIADGWVQLATDLQVGEKVKLIRKDGSDIYAVQAVRDGAFQVDLAENSEVFVYGREVDDFHTVDYEAIAMLNVSATQALYQRMQQQQEEIAALQKLQAENNTLKAQLAGFEKRLAQIEAALLSEKSDNADSVSD